MGHETRGFVRFLEIARASRQVRDGGLPLLPSGIARCLFQVSRPLSTRGFRNIPESGK